MPRKTTRKRTTPLTLADLQRWDNFTSMHGAGGDIKEARGVDKRLFTIPPAILGLMDAMDRNMKPTAEVVRLANRAVGRFQRDSYNWNANADPARAHVVLDWAVRYAFPIWLERLPQWCDARFAGDQLRELSSLQWIDAIVLALGIVTPAWVSLIEGPITHQGIARERFIIQRVGDVAGEIIGALAQELEWLMHKQVNRSNPTRRDTGHCRGIVRAVATAHSSLGANSLDDAQIAASLPRLIDVLLDVSPGDSQQSIADRCNWTTTTRKARK